MSNNYFTNQYHDYGLLPYPNANNPEQFLSNINFLQEKITATTRELTYWDLYRISNILSDPNNFQGAVNDLLPYTSLVINTKITGDTDYSPGDIIIKNPDGSIEKITAERGGIFWPKIIQRSSQEGNYNYSFEFAYSATPPTTTEKQYISNVDNTWDASDKYSSSLIFQNLTGSSVGSPYNQYQVNNISNTTPITAATRADGTTPIEPVVKFFIATQNDELGVTEYEEVYCDFKLTYDDDSEPKQYKIEFSPNKPSIINKMVVK